MIEIGPNLLSPLETFAYALAVCVLFWAMTK